MTGGMLNLVANGENNKILNSDPKKTFFKSSYAKYTNFGLQRFTINSEERVEASLFTDSLFKFKIPNYGDLLMDTVLAIDIPDIYSPLYIPPQPYNQDSKPFPDLSGQSYCQPYEFKFIENLGAQIIRKISYKIDGRTIQEFSGQYIYCKAQRDYGNEKKEIFNEMIGNTKELTDPENYLNNNGNYPSVSWAGLSTNSFIGGSVNLNSNISLEPSIRGRTIFVPIGIWENSSSYNSFPMVALQYSILEIHVELRPINEIFTIKSLDTFDNWLVDLSSVTQLPNDINNVFQYYNPLDVSPDFNDERIKSFYFLETPVQNQFGVGDFSYNSIIPSGLSSSNFFKEYFNEVQGQFKEYNSTFYTSEGYNIIKNIRIISTFAFLDEKEKRRVAGLPQRYLVKKIYEKTIPFAQGVQKENVDANGLTSSWMWFFQRTDVKLRNQWSNYSNWLYEDRINKPCLLIMDLSFALSSNNESYPNPIENDFNYQLGSAFNPFNKYISGAYHPGNEKTIMVDWGLNCEHIERETILPAGVNNYIEKYLTTKGNAKDGLYCYNFNINNSTEPSGAMNLRKFNNVYFEFSTINPYREVNNTGTEEDNLNEKLFNVKNCEENDVDFKEAYKDIDKYFTGAFTGGEFYSVSNPNYKDYNYNYNLHIMEERYNVLEFSNGMANYLFPV